MLPTVAFVGAGPTTIYTLNALLNAAGEPFRLLILEEQDVAGRGTPYRPGWNDPAMLSNIASVEIPAIDQTLADWLRVQPIERLERIGVDPEAINDQSFYPRIALGEYLHDQFDALLSLARSKGIDVDLRTRSKVIDAAPDGDGFKLRIQPRHGSVVEEHCEFLVMATGHQWPEEPEVRPGYFLSPWPASALKRIPACRVGIRGTSLTAIDAAVVLALRFGEFVERGSDLTYEPAGDTRDFQLTMMSRKGLLPEADFYHPIPYEPLSICTTEAIDALISQGSDGLLDQAFDLFKQELKSADPDYAQKVGLDGLDVEAFRGGYFARRLGSAPFEWARINLAEAEQNHETQTTVPWRYAILRMHEVIAPIVPHLEDEDFERFNRYLKPVFVDDYATVPHESVRRLLALHDAAKLDLLALGEYYKIDTRTDDDGAILHLTGKREHFPVFIEATGQHPLGIEEFPLPTLKEQGIVQDAAVGEDRAAKGVLVDEQFHPISEGRSVDRLFCLSLPFILGRHPFVQGITSSHDLGKTVGEELAASLTAHSTRDQVDHQQEAAAK